MLWRRFVRNGATAFTAGGRMGPTLSLCGHAVEAGRDSADVGGCKARTSASAERLRADPNDCFRPVGRSCAADRARVVRRMPPARAASSTGRTIHRGFQSRFSPQAPPMSSRALRRPRAERSEPYKPFANAVRRGPQCRLMACAYLRWGFLFRQGLLRSRAHRAGPQGCRLSGPDRVRRGRRTCQLRGCPPSDPCRSHKPRQW